MRARLIPIWFFIGLLLDLYGVLILGAGLYELLHPPAAAVAMAHLHAALWWGALLLVLGLIYTWKFAPEGESEEEPAARGRSQGGVP